MAATRLTSFVGLDRSLVNAAVIGVRGGLVVAFRVPRMGGTYECCCCYYCKELYLGGPNVCAVNFFGDGKVGGLCRVVTRVAVGTRYTCQWCRKFL